MTHETAQALIDKLDELLDEERRALLNGDLEKIGTLLTRKEVLIDTLNAQEPDTQASIANLRGKVLRNQALLDGALQGIRTVAGRLAAFRKVRRTLETYDKTGRKSEISDIIEHKVEKRA
ncbi:flagellar export chaperone FlgN [Roseovarius arcticus]|uniref:flagellar export chaperone FlgN n=1 Tax=Roseovarius arcticus TaxID=2547404 RepID=UPI00111000FD|nr:flagellar export chaperone FlgN [Roseovarius arcticus]